MRRLASLLVIATLAACAGPQKRQDALEKRVATVEAELVKLRAEVAERERADAEARAASSASLDEKLGQLEERLKAQPRPRPARRQPDPAKTYSVPVAGSPAEGPATAKVTIVYAGEYACPFCHKVKKTLADLRAKYGNDLRIVYKSFIVHPQVATAAALGACAAHKQGRWREMDEALWSRVFEARNFDEKNVVAIAKDLKLNMKRFEADRGQPCRDTIDADQSMLAGLGIGATPAFFINGRFLSGAQPMPSFEALIDEEMAKANEAIKKGVKAKDYYDTIVSSGLVKLDTP